MADSAADQGHIDTQPSVTLTPEKIVAAGVQIATVAEQELQATNTVPGTLQYDSTRHLELRAPVECVVTEVKVRTGQWLEQGEQNCSIDERANWLCGTRSRNARRICESRSYSTNGRDRTYASLTEFLSFLKQDPTMPQIESQFEGKLLGEHRDHLISAYSQYLLATRVADRTRSLGEQGVVSGRTLEERASQREIAAAAFNAVCEQSEFESRHQREVSAAAVEVAERALAVSRERLSVMLGPHGQETAAEQWKRFRADLAVCGSSGRAVDGRAARFAEGNRSPCWPTRVVFGWQRKSTNGIGIP